MLKDNPILFEERIEKVFSTKYAIQNQATPLKWLLKCLRVKQMIYMSSVKILFYKEL